MWASSKCQIRVGKLGKKRSGQTHQTLQIRSFLSSFSPGIVMSIVMISEPMLKKATATDGRILRDRVLSGFGVRLNARKRTFLIATSVSGKQFRMMLGHWPLMTVEQARSHAMDVLRPLL
jgi:hypothetical protein